MEIFNKETIWDKRAKPPVVRISKHGHVRFSVEAVKLLGITKDTPITFMIDPRDHDIVYFYIDKEKGLPLVNNNKSLSGVGLQICCRPMAIRILRYFSMKNGGSFDITNDKCSTVHGEMWFIRKDKTHIPVKWRKKQSPIL